MDLLDLTNGFKKVYLKGSQTKGLVKVNEDDFNDLYIEERRPKKGTKYTEEYILKESLEQTERLSGGECSQQPPFESDMSSLEVASAGTFSNINNLQKEELTHVYKEYYKNTPKVDNRLVISDYKSKILSMIELNEVTIIAGPTGCGKTTQVPQFILDSHAEQNLYCNIIVTQPRRIAAISIPKRVCEERDWALGTICGYKVGLKECTSEDTRLTYVTVGVFLQMLISTKHMNDYTHVILDEVHERDEVMDFVLLTTKKLLKSTSRNVKLILMSATADVQKVASYFEKPILGKLQPAPIINIAHSTNYIVQIHYLEELAPLGQLPEMSFEEPGISETGMMTCIKLIKQFERLDKDTKNKKSVLVFLPGMCEIEELFNKLSDPKIYNPGTVEYKWFPIPLHSMVTVEEQALTFRPPPTGYRKIILATNIAESSITVPDVMFVIDFCLTKVLTTDQTTNFTSLQLCWASKANCIQRAGRAGRVMEGRVYRMVYKKIYQAFDDQCTPSILRCPLEKVILQAKLLDIGSPKAVLALALDPPDLSNIERTILSLKEVGGLLLTSKGVKSATDGDLTYLGRLMALFPVDVQITRLLVLGHAFSCLEECIIMGACLSLKSAFSSPFLAKLKSYNSKLEWADGSCSDCIAFLNVYDVWRMNHMNGYFKRSAGGGEAGWAKRHFIQIGALKEVQILVDELTRRLKINRIEKSVGVGRVQWSDVQKPFVLKFVLAGAFYPNYFFRGARGGQVNEEEAVKILGGRNPFTTVYLTNYPREQPPELYSHLIKEQMLECKEDMKISYDNSSKVYIEFRKDYQTQNSEIPFNSKVPGKICTAVYRAVKMRQLSKHLDIRVLPPEQAKKLAEKLGVERRADALINQASGSGNGKDKLFKTILPGIDVSFMPINITHMIDPGHFWASNKDEINDKNEKEIFEMLNDPGVTLNIQPKLPEVGEMCAAPYKDEEETWLYRGRVDGLREISGKTFAQIYFIDYGNTELVPVNELRQYGPDLYEKIGKIPALAFECVLTKIKPCAIKNPNGKWCEAAKREFRKQTTNARLISSIYSVVDGVVSLVLYKIVNYGGSTSQININQHLIKEGYAEEAEESYLSKANNELRAERQLDSDQKDAYNNLQIQDTWLNGSSFQPPDLRNCHVMLKLGGPHSPLEMKIFSYTRGGLSKHVQVASTSVNSVLLDSDPQDPHERLIVAGRVSQNQSGNKLILHNTTILPNIHGLAALIPFVFAPVIELRVDEKRTKYTGLICGLGADENNESLFPEHDMEIIFDCQFTWDDFCTINKLRFFMSLLLLDEKDEIEPMHTHPDVILFQNKIKKCLLKLIDTTRPSMELHFPKKEFKWGLVASNVKVADDAANLYSQMSIFPFHPGVEITPNPNEKKTLLSNLNLLKSIARKKVESEHHLECKLCQMTLADTRSIRLHLTTERHKSKESKLLESLST